MLFNMMQETYIRPNELTFTGIPNACGVLIRDWLKREESVSG